MSLWSIKVGVVMVFVCGCMRSANLGDGAWVGDTNVCVLCCFGDGDVYSVACRMLQSDVGRSGPSWLEYQEVVCHYSSSYGGCAFSNLILPEFCEKLVKRAFDDPKSVVFDARWQNLLPDIFSQLISDSEIVLWRCLDEKQFLAEFVKFFCGKKKVAVMVKSVGVFCGEVSDFPVVNRVASIAAGAWPHICCPKPAVLQK